MVFMLTAAFCVAAIANAETRYDGYQVIQCMPDTWTQVATLTALPRLGLYVNFWKPPSKPGKSVDVMLRRDEMDYFRNAIEGIQMKVIVADVQGLIDKEKKELQSVSQFPENGNPVLFTLDQYHSLDDIYNWLNTLSSTHSDLVRTFTIGKSYENRTMMGVILGKYSKVSSSKHGIWLDAGIHAREWVAPATALFIINELVTKYNSNSLYQQLLDNLYFYILPSANPDGYEYSRNSDRLWRKTRHPYHKKGWFGKRTCYGADPNRNFDFHWIDSGTSKDPCDDTYGGPKPFSEIECQNIANFLLANKNSLKSYISLHSYGDLWMYGYGYARHTYPPDVDQLRNLSIVAAKAIKAVNGVEYEIGSPTDILYAASGASDDWAKGVANIKWTYTLELRPGPTDPDPDKSYGFQLPSEYISPTAKEAWAGILTVAQRVLSMS